MANQRVLLASRPTGWVAENNFRIEEAPVPQPGEGEVLVKNLWLSLDPYMRGRMSDAKSYVKGVDLGEVMVGQTVGEVIESRHPTLKKGDKVLAQLGWQLYGVTREANKVDEKRAPLSCYLGVIGMPGMTAYFGLKEIGEPKAGETVVVSAARISSSVRYAFPFWLSVRKSPMPSVDRAETTSLSAMGAPTTQAFSPCRSHASPDFLAMVFTAERS